MNKAEFDKIYKNSSAYSYLCINGKGIIFFIFKFLLLLTLKPDDKI